MVCARACARTHVFVCGVGVTLMVCIYACAHAHASPTRTAHRSMRTFIPAHPPRARVRPLARPPVRRPPVRLSVPYVRPFVCVGVRSPVHLPTGSYVHTRPRCMCMCRTCHTCVRAGMRACVSLSVSVQEFNFVITDPENQSVSFTVLHSQLSACVVNNILGSTHSMPAS